VLTASRRLAHALRLNHAAQAQERGLIAWRTPQILPWTTWLREQWVERRAEENSLHALRLLTPAQTRLLWEQIIADSSFAANLLSPLEAARMAARSWHKLHDYLIDYSRLQHYDSLESAALHAWCAQFEARCEALSAIDEARLAHWAWATQLIPSEPLSFVGFDAFSPSVSRLIDRWRARGYIAPDSPNTRSGGRVSVVGFNDREAEIEAAARWARAQIELGASRVAVVLDDLASRSEEVRRSFAEIFAPASRSLEHRDSNAPFIVAAPKPLSQYPIVDAALCILELMHGGVDGRLVGRLLRSPFVVDEPAERDARAMADARLRNEQREDWSIYEFERWSSMTGCTALALAARDAAQLHRGLPTRAATSVWAERFHALLQAFWWPGSRPLSSVEQQTMLKFQASLTELGSLDELLGPVTLTSASRELRKLANETAFEPETAAALVTVIDATTVAGMDFESIWVAGLDASRFPRPSQPDPLIPQALQREAGIAEATPEQSFAMSTARLQRLLRSAGSLVFSWPQRDGDAELQISPLLAEFAQHSADTLAQSRARDLRSASFTCRPALEVLQDDCAPTLATAGARGGARILELQSLCPFRAQATLRLIAEPLTKVGPGFDARRRGIFIHRVLEDFWSKVKDQRTLLSYETQTIEALLRIIAQNHAARWLPATSRPRSRLAYLEIESAVQRVLQLLRIDRERPEFTVRRTEAEEVVSIAGLRIRLQPDRIDEVQGGYFLVDYKLGDAHTPRKWLDRKPGRPEQPQLPLYALEHGPQLAGLAFATLAPGSIEYRGWHRGMPIAPGVLEFPRQVRRAPSMPPDWSTLLGHWRVVLDDLAAQFVRGAAAVNPLPQACTYCHLSTFCRIHERGMLIQGEEAESDE
jgi:ATP-dependent helicase/nuclease subunit B